MTAIERPVDAYMSAPVHTAHAADRLTHVEQLLADLRISSLPVVDDDDRLVGVISRTDLLRVGRYQPSRHRDATLIQLPELAVADVMTAEPITVAPEATVAAACDLLCTRGVHRVYAVADDVLVGVLSTHDVLLAISDARLETPLAALMSRPLFTIDHVAPVSAAAGLLDKARIWGVVITEDDWPVGLFTQTEALAAKDAPPDTPVEDLMSAALLCLPDATRVHRAAAYAHTLGVRRVIASRDREAVGILTGIDFAHAAR